jgi:hypothetical protein
MASGGRSSRAWQHMAAGAPLPTMQLAAHQGGPGAFVAQFGGQGATGSENLHEVARLSHRGPPCHCGSCSEGGSERHGEGDTVVGDKVGVGRCETRWGGGR